MPPSVNNRGWQPGPPPPPGQRLAVLAESLYLINLLILPVLGFLALVWLYYRNIPTAAPLAVCHLQQTLSASLWAGVLLVIANIIIVGLGGYDRPYTWVVGILYFTIGHTVLVVLGLLGLAKAMAGQPFRFPLVGRPCRE